MGSQKGKRDRGVMQSNLGTMSSVLSEGVECAGPGMKLQMATPA